MRNNINLKNIAVIVSIVLVAVSMAANFAVYQSLSTGADSIVFSILGISFDFLKLVLVIFAGILWSRSHAMMALVAGTFFITLSCISAFTAFGFAGASIEKVESAKAAASEQVTRKQSELDNVTSQINGLAAVASYNISSLKMDYATLQEKLTTERATLLACPPKYFKNCIRPSEARIAALSTQVQPLNTKIGEYERYNGLLEHKKGLDTEYANLLAGGGAIAAISPIFSIPSQVLKISAVKIKFYFLTLSSLILELGSSFLVLCTSVIFSPKTASNHTQTNHNQEHDITPQTNPTQAHPNLAGTPVKKPLTSPMGDIKGVPFNSLNGGKVFANAWQTPRSHDAFNNNNMRSHAAPIMATDIRGESVQRVAVEKSQKSASGRLGKVDICANPDCDEMFLVTAYNKIYHTRSCCEAAKKKGAK